VGVLGHLAALIRVEENVVDVERGSNEGLLVGLGDRDRSGGAVEGLDGPEALADGLDVKVDLNLVVLYEPLLPPLSGYLSAFSFQINKETLVSSHPHPVRVQNENCGRGLDYILSFH
jgi:hypothetical protein